ncbi:hypothetical protein [Vulcanisaeta thermophila]|uniref:hypothetical protein n=1 Tax=Vulcanisaeta thermophila TaxID=867917 RepID=UPI0008532059|nr:hypothetical protein [Vulcanisaeta thermophila]
MGLLGGDALALALIVGLGVSHAVEPDHVVTMRLLGKSRDVVVFGLAHGLGFALISIPLVLALSINGTSRPWALPWGLPSP